MSSLNINSRNNMRISQNCRPRQARKSSYGKITRTLPETTRFVKTKAQYRKGMLAVLTGLMTTIAVGLISAGGNKTETNPSETVQTTVETTESSLCPNQNVEDEDILSVILPTLNYTVSTEAEKEAQTVEFEETIVKDSAQEFLLNLKKAGGDAYEHYEKLCNALNMNKTDTAKYLTYLANSEKYGNGCIDPVLWCAQICQESFYDPSAIGDNGLALGFGQFHSCAVEEVNNQISYGTYGDYTYNNGQKYTDADRANPKKALEMMILLLRYDFKKTGSTEGMLAMYNRGHKDGINTEAGRKYVDDVFGRLEDISDSMIS